MISPYWRWQSIGDKTSFLHSLSLFLSPPSLSSRIEREHIHITCGVCAHKWLDACKHIYYLDYDLKFSPQISNLFECVLTWREINVRKTRFFSSGMSIWLLYTLIWHRTRLLIEVEWRNFVCFCCCFDSTKIRRIWSKQKEKQSNKF